LKAAAPKFYAVPHNRVAEEGETVRFQCAIAGHPTPWVTWDKDGLTVTPSTRLTLSERDDLRILEISEVTAEDAGFYRITLENEVGRVEASARLEVIGELVEGGPNISSLQYSTGKTRSHASFLQHYTIDLLLVFPNPSFFADNIYSCFFPQFYTYAYISLSGRRKNHSTAVGCQLLSLF
jgi:hypothetical protein